MKPKHCPRDLGIVRLGKGLGKHLSYRGIHRLAKGIAGIVNALPEKVLRLSIKKNLKIVLGSAVEPKQIDDLSKVVIRNLWHMHADYFYYYQHPAEGKEAIKLSAATQEMIDDVLVRKIPTLIAGPHLGNFDLFGLSLAWQKVPMMVLSVPNPSGTYLEQNKMRTESGVKVAPIDMHSLHEGRKFLLEGNCLITGIDRPVENPENAKYKALFFGKPAAVPMFYTRFGLEDGVNVRVSYCILQEDGSYMMECSDPIPMRHYNQLNEEYEQNAAAVLKVVEKAIRQHLEQWMMLLPVWGNSI